MNPQIDLFSPVKLGPYTLPNRIVMAPLTRNRAGLGNAPVPLNEYDRSTFFGGDAKGYIDYPSLEVQTV